LRFFIAYPIQSLLPARLGPDEYLGQVTDMTSRLHGGAAYLLLVLPR
jgi:hypothetical protein